MKHILYIVLFFVCLSSQAQIYNINNKTVNGQTAVKLEIRQIAHNLSSTTAKVYYAYYNTSGNVIAEGNTTVSGGISAGSNTALQNALSSFVGSYDYARMMINGNGSSSYKFFYSKSGGTESGVKEISGSYINSTDQSAIKGNTATQLGVTFSLQSEIQTLPTSDDGRYNSFGTLVTISPTKKMYVFRSGTTHLTGGRVDAIDYDVATKTWSNRRTIYTYTNPLDARDPRAGLINGKIYVFFARRQEGGDGTANTQRGYIVSTDPTGASWSSYNSLTVPRYGTPWGVMVAGDVSGTYMIPFWESDLSNGGRWDMGYYKTTDNGATWTQIYVKQQTTYHITESCLANCGGGKLIYLCRVETFYGKPGNLMQCISTDGGATWSALQSTNLGGGSGVSMPTLRYDTNSNTLTAFFHNRTLGYIQVSAWNIVSSVFASPTAWRAAQNYHFIADVVVDGRNGLGYPDFDFQIAVWAKELSTSNTILQWREDDFSQYLP